jgi:4-hydroxybenzoate polyprenyltransferase
MATTVSTAPGAPLARVALLARDIKLSHSIFALPFALLAAFLAAAHDAKLPGAATLGLIVLCMVLARTWAMAINRWADAPLDAANPRTARRAIPSGRLPRSFVLAAALACGFALLAAASGFWFLNHNPWPLIFAPAVLAWLALYSFTKRFTWLSHLFLGTALALSPLAAALAVEPHYLTRPDAYLLAAMVTCWVAGFDIIYSLQDIDIDRRAGLFSMPSRLGVNPALNISRVLHAASVGFLLLLVIEQSEPVLGVFFLIGVALVAALLALEHGLVCKSRTHQINTAFFTVNGVISLLLGAVGIFDVFRFIPSRVARSDAKPRMERTRGIRGSSPDGPAVTPVQDQRHNSANRTATQARLATP